MNPQKWSHTEQCTYIQSTVFSSDDDVVSHTNANVYVNRKKNHVQTGLDRVFSCDLRRKSKEEQGILDESLWRNPKYDFETQKKKNYFICPNKGKIHKWEI